MKLIRLGTLIICMLSLVIIFLLFNNKKYLNNPDEYLQTKNEEVKKIEPAQDLYEETVEKEQNVDSENAVSINFDLYIITGVTSSNKNSKAQYYLLVDKIEKLEKNNCQLNKSQDNCTTGPFKVYNTDINPESYLLDNDGDIFVSTDSLQSNFGSEMANSSIIDIIDDLRGLPFDIEIDEGEIESIEEFPFG